MGKEIKSEKHQSTKSSVPKEKKSSSKKTDSSKSSESVLQACRSVVSAVAVLIDNLLFVLSEKAAEVGRKRLGYEIERRIAS